MPKPEEYRVMPTASGMRPPPLDPRRFYALFPGKSSHFGAAKYKHPRNNSSLSLFLYFHTGRTWDAFDEATPGCFQLPDHHRIKTAASSMCVTFAPRVLKFEAGSGSFQEPAGRAALRGIVVVIDNSPLAPAGL